MMPHARSLAATVAVCAALAGTTAAQDATDLPRLRAAALDLVNDSREQHGLGPLESSPELDGAARAHAEDMLERGYHDHVSPEGETPMDRYLEAGGDRWRRVEENIGHCATCAPPATAGDVEDMHEGWMESPEHRAAILGEGTTHFGFGVAAGQGDGLYAVQTFAGPGAPRTVEPGEEMETLSREAQLSLGVKLVNRARRNADIAPLEASEPLATAAGRLLPEDPQSSLGEMGDLSEALPAEERGRWRALSVVAGRCGGCGVEPTAADLRHFIRQWLDSPEYEGVLLDPSISRMGIVVRANGTGRKTAIAVLGRR